MYLFIATIRVRTTILDESCILDYTRNHNYVFGLKSWNIVSNSPYTEDLPKSLRKTEDLPKPLRLPCKFSIVFSWFILRISPVL